MLVMSVFLIGAGSHSWNKVLNECLNRVTALNQARSEIKFVMWGRARGQWNCLRIMVLNLI